MQDILSKAVLSNAVKFAEELSMTCRENEVIILEASQNVLRVQASEGYYSVTICAPKVTYQVQRVKPYLSSYEKEPTPSEVAVFASRLLYLVREFGVVIVEQKRDESKLEILLGVSPTNLQWSDNLKKYMVGNTKEEALNSLLTEMFPKNVTDFLEVLTRLTRETGVELFESVVSNEIIVKFDYIKWTLLWNSVNKHYAIKVDSYNDIKAPRSVLNYLNELTSLVRETNVKITAIEPLFNKITLSFNDERYTAFLNRSGVYEMSEKLRAEETPTYEESDLYTLPSDYMVKTSVFSKPKAVASVNAPRIAIQPADIWTVMKKSNYDFEGIDEYEDCTKFLINLVNKIGAEDFKKLYDILNENDPVFWDFRTLLRNKGLL